MTLLYYNARISHGISRAQLAISTNADTGFFAVKHLLGMLLGAFVPSLEKLLNLGSFALHSNRDINR